MEPVLQSYFTKCHICFFLLQQSTPVILFEEAVQDGEQFIACTDKHTAHAWSTAVVPVNIEIIIFCYQGPVHMHSKCAAVIRHVNTHTLHTITVTKNLITLDFC